MPPRLSPSWNTQVEAAILTSLSTATTTPVVATDSTLSAIGKLQGQLTAFAPKAIGTALVNFGVTPGGVDAQLVITGQSGIVSASVVQAWISPATTTDHSIDEHWAEDLFVVAGNVVPGTGFTLYAKSPSSTYGAFSVSWTWS